MSLDTILPISMATELDIHNPTLKEVVIKEVEDYFAEHGLQMPKDKSLYDQLVRKTEEALFSVVLNHTNGNEAKASQMLGISLSTLRQRLALFGRMKMAHEVI